MEIVVPVQEFHFDSTSTTPFVSAPSSPKHFVEHFDFFHHYTSAPTSPSRAAAIYAHFSTTISSSSSATTTTASVPFDWEETPGTPKSTGRHNSDIFDFAFDFSGQLEKGRPPPAISAADELFEAGKIRPLKPPPRLQYQEDRSSLVSSPRSPKPKGFLSPRHRGHRGGGGGDGFDPFAKAMEETTRDRGRERFPVSGSFSSSRSRKGSRSLSPLRGIFPLSLNSPSPTTTTTTTTTTSASSAASAAPAALKGGGIQGGGSKKWRLRDLLLFRSASEGRVTGGGSKDPLRKYTVLSSSSLDTKNSSFRSTDSSGSMRRRSSAAVSAHEMHYTANRAVAEEMKKKTPLPYRQGLFGCLRFNPAVNSITRGFTGSSFSRGRS